MLFRSDGIADGDVVLLQADSVEQTMPWLNEHYRGRLREINARDLVGQPATQTPPAERQAVPASLQSGPTVEGPAHP